MRIFSTIILFTLINACASSSGVMNIGNEIFSITAQAATAPTAKQDALNESANFCKNKKQQINVLDMKASSDAMGWHSISVNFKCTNS